VTENKARNSKTERKDIGKRREERSILWGSANQVEHTEKRRSVADNFSQYQSRGRWESKSLGPKSSAPVVPPALERKTVPLKLKEGKQGMEIGHEIFIKSSGCSSLQVDKNLRKLQIRCLSERKTEKNIHDTI